VDLSAQLDMYHHHIYTIVICADMNLMFLLLELNNDDKIEMRYLTWKAGYISMDVRICRHMKIFKIFRRN
jgi:uncharacterized integral membrane protein